MILGNELKNAVISASNNLNKHKRAINELNIFPVPDGDTGTNMSMTISTAAQALEGVSDSAGASEVAKVVASAMLRGARGNSGVILSLLFRGISSGLEGKSSISSESLVDALDIGVDEAYKAVMRPTEGTILTVARVAAERGREAFELGSEPQEVFDAISIGAWEALEQTPELLPVLKKAGVVDAGGQGLCVIFDGMLSVFRNGIIVEAKMTEEERVEETAEFFRNAAAEFDSIINFTYCTEFIVGRESGNPKDPIELRGFLENIGDSVVVVDDDEIIKVHVHTEAPGDALQMGLQYGELLTVKIENMREQHKNAKIEYEASKKPDKKQLERQEPTLEAGFVAVAAGDGLIGLFEELGCTHVVSGGQTMNPSTEDFIEAILATPAKNVFVLPNNKNIILAAEQTIPLVTDRDVIVVPTKTVPQGLSAMLAYNPDMPSGTNEAAMVSAAEVVQTGNVTFAARDSEFDGYNISRGDIMGLANGKLEYIDDNPVTVCAKVAKQLSNRHTAFITLIYGCGMTEADAEAAKELIAAKLHSGVEINIVNGGQPIYYFIISVE